MAENRLVTLFKQNSTFKNDGNAIKNKKANDCAIIIVKIKIASSI